MSILRMPFSGKVQGCSWCFQLPGSLAIFLTSAVDKKAVVACTAPSWRRTASRCDVFLMAFRMLWRWKMGCFWTCLFRVLPEWRLWLQPLFSVFFWVMLKCSAVGSKNHLQVLKRTEGISTTQIIGRIIQQQGWTQVGRAKRFLCGFKRSLFWSLCLRLIWHVFDVIF